MYRGVIIYAPSVDRMEQLVRRLADCFDGRQIEVDTCAADRAAITDLTRADLFLLASLPSGDQPIHPDFAEILRALRGISLAGRSGGACSVDSEATVSAFRRALGDCEIGLQDENFRSFPSADLEAADLCGWVNSLHRQLEGPARG
jgi:hypothetical protein